MSRSGLYTVLIFAIFCIFMAFSSVSDAGMSLTSSRHLKILEVMSCEKLSTENVAYVSAYTTQPTRNNWTDKMDVEWTDARLQKFVAANPGYVIKAIIKEMRDLSRSFSPKTWPLISEDSLTEDSGWRESEDTDPHYYYLSGKYMDPLKDGCEDFKKGSIVHVEAPLGRGGCDTVPPQGLCAFSSPMSKVNPDIWKKYGK